MTSFEPTRYESGRPMLLSGLRRQHPFSESGRSLPAQWEQFRSIGQIPGRLGANVYGVMCGHNSDGFEYMCAVEVESFAALPDGFGRMRVQAQDYGVFEHRGHVSTIRTTWERIFEWLSTSASYQSANKPDFEVYRETFDSHTGVGGVEIWISIARRQPLSGPAEA
ncbi:MAG TPA: GyrI-like domain-containing protein [Blastocatellia bacterium]|nr:GyrI-like domain-containing protein [Blastocatellia bacterium]